jgi:streptogramin lyase
MLIVGSVYAQNLLLNPSFETSGGTYPLYWDKDVFTWGNNLEYVTSGGAYDGNSYFRVEVNSIESDDIYFGFSPDDNNYQFDGDCLYTLTFNYRMDSSNLRPRIGIHHYSRIPSGLETYIYEDLGTFGYGETTGEWHEGFIIIYVDASYECTECVENFIKLTFGAKGNGSETYNDGVDYDNIRLEVISCSSTSTPTPTSPQPTSTPDPSLPTPTPHLASDLLVGSINFNGVGGTRGITRYDSTTGEFKEVYFPGGIIEFHGFGFGLDGNLITCNFEEDSIGRYNSISRDFIDDFIPSNSGGLDLPVEFIYDDERNMLVTSCSTDSVLRYNGHTGEFIDKFVSSGSGGLNLPWDLEFGPDGNLYVTGINMVGVKRYNGQTGVFIDTFISPSQSQLEYCYNMCFGPDGNIYIGEDHKNCIYRFNGQTGDYMDTFVQSGSGGLNRPRELAFGPDGNLYVAALYGLNVLRYNGQTGEFIDVFIPEGSGGMGYPEMILFTSIKDCSGIDTWNNYE